jgi:hypothetical protein
MKSRRKTSDSKIEKVRNTSVTRLEVSLPAVIELLPGYELTVEKLEADESIELEIWQESATAQPLRLGFVIVAKEPVPKEMDTITDLWI